MQVISTFFNNEEYYMDNILHWYRTIWNCKKFIFFIGKHELKETNFSTGGINFFVREEEDITYYEYKSNPYNTATQWSHFKHIFIENVVDKRIPSLWVDCDEFVYCKDVENTLSKPEFRTHFYEYVPVIPFEFDSDSLWSVQPWYYREQSFNNNHNNRITHNNCKVFHLDKSRAGHMGKSNYCKNSNDYDDYDNICFHVAVQSKKYFFSNCQQWDVPINGKNVPYNKHRIQTEIYDLNVSDEDIFNKYFIGCEFDTFNLNLYEKYIKNNNK